MMHITEDTPPDMLVGAMDLTVHLPTGRSVKMSVDRSTPMMDLLVQITNAQHLQLSGYIIEALGMAPSADRGDKILPYKPNTPIGALDTQHVRVVPKGRTLPVPKNVPPGHQPFESTFRLKVHLPRNQLYVCRVSRHVRLEEIIKKVCEEKNLDPAKYEFRHPGNLDEVLDYKLTLSDYQITEIYVVTRGTVSLTQTFTSSDIMALRKEEERKQMAAKTGGGVFNLIFKRGKTNRTSGSLSSENRSISPTRSDDSRSITPPQQIVTPPPPDLPEKPKPPQRKRRPAPKPPQKPPETPPIEISNGSQSNGEMKKLENGLTICHSRNSSDSSGFHETSVLSENCTLPRRPKNACEDNLSRGQSLSNLHKMSVHSKSTSSLTQAGRKKRAAPLPPPLPVVRSSSSVSALEKPSPLVASHSVESEAPVEVSDRLVEPELDSLEPAGHYNRRPVETTFSEVETEKLGSADSLSSALTLQTSTDSMTSLQPPSYTPSPPCSEISSLSGISQKAIEPRIVETKPTPETIVEKSEPKPPEPLTEASRTDPEKVDEEITDIDWQYQLPSPPKAFRDSSPPLPEVTRTDSVRASTQLFEKLSHVKDPEVETVTISDSTSNLSDEDKKMCNKLTLEHLEKRKTLVYNRELSTSLKMSDDDTKKNSVFNELESTIHNYVPKNVSRRNSHAQESRQSNNANIPNFVITTYDAPKKQINIFEDDSIHTNKDNGSKRSSFAESADTTDQSLRKHSFTSMENISYRKHSVGNQSDDGLFKKPLDVSKFKSKPLNGNFVTRSGSFSIDYDANNWKPVNPVKRSKSQLTVAKKEGQFKEEGMTKADSSFDVSGLQSLGVMRMIQTKLNTPTSSVENLHHEEKQPAKAEQESPAPPPKPEKSESKSYHYRGPPAINLSTWSERPKTQISLKDDTDYKIKTDVPKSKSTVDIFNKTTYNGNESICIKTDNNSNNVSIKINGAEPLVTQKIGNVVIKIGHSSETIYRKPLGNINGTERPHSVAFDSSFDISRVPIVRSVELKKPFKEPHMNRSVTQIYSSNEPPRTFSDYKNDKFTDNRRSSENLNERNFNKPVVRISSFATNTPVVRGFRNIENGKSNRNSWTPTSNTTPSSKPNVFKSEEVNKNGNYTDSYKDHPFGNVILRNTPNSINKRNSFGYSNSFSAEAANKNPPPPPPQLPKLNTFTKRPQKVVEPETDSRSELLSAIRNFGGKKGLKTVKM